MSDTESTEMIRQVNTSGAVLHVPALGVDVWPGEDVEFPELLPGFTAAESEQAADAANPTASAKPAAAPVPAPTAVTSVTAAPAKPTDEPKPADAAPADAAPKE